MEAAADVEAMKGDGWEVEEFTRFGAGAVTRTDPQTADQSVALRDVRFVLEAKASYLATPTIDALVAAVGQRAGATAPPDWKRLAFAWGSCAAKFVDALRELKAGSTDASSALTRLVPVVSRLKESHPVPSSWSGEGLAYEYCRVAHEWADLAADGVNWLRNVADGFSTPDEALAHMEALYVRISGMKPGSVAVVHVVPPSMAEIRALAESVKEAWKLAGKLPPMAWEFTEFIESGMRVLADRLCQRHLAEEQAVDGRRAAQALIWLDDFVARCNGDDRGSCPEVNILRAAFSTAFRPLNGRQVWDGPVAVGPGLAAEGDFEGWARHQELVWTTAERQAAELGFHGARAVRWLGSIHQADNDSFQSWAAHQPVAWTVAERQAAELGYAGGMKFGCSLVEGEQ